MSITYPLSLPTSIGIESIELRAVNAVATSQSPFTYKQQIVAHQGQRWEASVSVPAVRRDLAAPWKAFLTSLKGQQGTFLLGDPDYVTARGKVSLGSPWFLQGGVWALGGEWDDSVSYDYVPPEGGVTAVPSVSGNQSANSDTLVITGFSPSVSGVFLAGDYIQLGSASSAQLYQVLQDASSNGSGEITLDIWPNLRTNVVDGAPVVVNSPKGIFRLANNISSWSINNSSAYGITFEAVEALV